MNVKHGSTLALSLALWAGNSLAQEEPAGSVIGSIQGRYDSRQVVVDVAFRVAPNFDTAWDFQLFIDADNNVSTGYARGFDLVVRGVGPLAPTVDIHRTGGGGGPAGWGALVGQASVRMLDAHHLRINLAFAAGGLTQGAVRFTFEVYAGGALLGTARDRSTAPGDGHVVSDCNFNGISDDRDIANGISEDCSGNGIPDECEPDCNSNAVADSCEIADDPSLDCDHDGVLGGCEAFARAVGSRYIAVKPTEGLQAVALLVRGAAEDRSVACVSRYVQANGTLSDAAHFAPSSEWCKVFVRGTEILPGHTYHVFEDRGTPRKPVLTNETVVTMWQRGDTNHDAVADFVDISRAVEAFLGVYTANLSVHMADFVADDESTCLPDGHASFKDISEVVNAFVDAAPSAVCPAPCR